MVVGVCWLAVLDFDKHEELKVGSMTKKATRSVITHWVLGLTNLPLAALVGWTTSSLTCALVASTGLVAVQLGIAWYCSRLAAKSLAHNLESERTALALAKSAMDGAQIAMMVVDRDFVIKYVNKKSQDLFRAHESDFRKLWPTFDANAMIGQCIDMFHRNPRHQRDMLANPANLPHSADIRVGELAFNLQVSAQIDPQGNYVGNLLEWADVTKQRQLEALDAAIVRSQLMVEYSTEGIVLNANENFLNTLGFSLRTSLANIDGTSSTAA